MRKQGTCRRDVKCDQALLQGIKISERFINQLKGSDAREREPIGAGSDDYHDREEI